MNENKKDFITKEAEIKYLRNRLQYLELENENLRLKLKLVETKKPQSEKKNKYVLVDPFFGEFPFERPESTAPHMDPIHGRFPCDPASPGPYGYEINDFPWWFRIGRTISSNSSSNKI